MQNTADRFWAKVRESGDCWIWSGQTRNGYGRTRWQGKSKNAHRVSYELMVGPIPEGLQLDHLCRTRACVNPAHLDPVPQRENLRRGEGPTAVNGRKTHCLNGHEFTAENTRISGGTRHCWTCHRARQRRADQSTPQTTE